jgi:hypothetical protein
VAKILEQLALSHIRVLCTAIDGDRGYMKCQEELLALYHQQLYDLSLGETCVAIFSSGWASFTTGWIADLLHVLKCQRCRLRTQVLLICSIDC